MTKKYLLSSMVAVTLVSFVVVALWAEATSGFGQGGQDNLRLPARSLAPVFELAASETVTLNAQTRGTIRTITSDKEGNVYLLSNDASASRGTGFIIQRTAPDGTMLATVPLHPEIWEPPLEVYNIAVGNDGTLYAAVEWDIKRGGIIAVAQDGTLKTKLTFADFSPKRITVDQQDQVWVVGREVVPAKVYMATKLRIPVDPKKPYEQIRVFTPDLKLLDMPVRNEKIGQLPSTISTADDEVIYYAHGTGTIRVFRQGQLVQKLTIPQLVPLAPPVEVLQGSFTTKRAVGGVYKIGDRFLLAGFYSYVATPGSGQQGALSKTFVALVSTNGEAASPEFDPPENTLPWAYSVGHLIGISSSGTPGSLKIKKMKPKI